VGPIARLWVAVALAAVLVGGCGGDKKQTDTGPKPPSRTQTATSQSPTTPQGPAPKTQTGVPKTTTSPEQATGGAGDENPARSQALLTGRGGRISPAVVRVPPYISIRIELRSADGRTYTLRFGRRRIQAGGQISSASASFPGLRPGKVLVGRPVGAGNRVRIEANAEPGP
jgi:hypothetical protein